MDLNIDFNACASIVEEGNGKFRLKPTLTAGQVSANNTGISGQVVDSATKAPIVGSVQVAIEQQDSAGVDRILMQAVADSNGNFNFCPLPTGTFDIVVVAIGLANMPYNATTVLNVPNGTNLGAILLIAELGATAPAIFQGFVTATNGAAAGNIDVSLSALADGGFRRRDHATDHDSPANHFVDAADAGSRFDGAHLGLLKYELPERSACHSELRSVHAGGSGQQSQRRHLRLFGIQLLRSDDWRRALRRGCQGGPTSERWHARLHAV